MSLWKDFKTFIMRGNVVDLAVAVVIGAAFGKVVNSFVNDILMPPIGILLSGIDFSLLEIKINSEVAIRYGVFINAIISFLIVAFSIFVVIKCLSILQKKKEMTPTEKKCPECCLSIPMEAKKCGHCGSPQ